MTTSLNPVDWDDDHVVVISFLHNHGSNSRYLTANEQWYVFCRGNGFGNCTSEQLEHSGWNWSHVRDSDDTGYARMANCVRELVPEAEQK